jgi:vacuolar-type H+-ATPase subunit F/Vma7
MFPWMSSWYASWVARVRSTCHPPAGIDAFAAREQAELERRERPFPDLRGKTVILVDDGLATGSTMRVAVEALRREGPARIVVAVPVSAPETCDALREVADEVVCAITPEPFHAVGLWYPDFTQTTDDEVHDLLARAQAGNGPGCAESLGRLAGCARGLAICGRVRFPPYRRSNDIGIVLCLEHVGSHVRGCTDITRRRRRRLTRGIAARPVESLLIESFLIEPLLVFPCVPGKPALGLTPGPTVSVPRPSKPFMVGDSRAGHRNEQVNDARAHVRGGRPC